MTQSLSPVGQQLKEYWTNYDENGNKNRCHIVLQAVQTHIRAHKPAFSQLDGPLFETIHATLKVREGLSELVNTVAALAKSLKGSEPPIEKLPSELLCELLDWNYFAKDFCNLGLVNKKWYASVHDPKPLAARLERADFRIPLTQLILFLPTCELHMRRLDLVRLVNEEDITEAQLGQLLDPCSKLESVTLKVIPGFMSKIPSTVKNLFLYNFASPQDFSVPGRQISVRAFHDAQIPYALARLGGQVSDLILGQTWPCIEDWKNYLEGWIEILRDSLGYGVNWGYLKGLNIQQRFDFHEKKEQVRQLLLVAPWLLQCPFEEWFRLIHQSDQIRSFSFFQKVAKLQFVALTVPEKFTLLKSEKYVHRKLRHLAIAGIDVQHLLHLSEDEKLFILYHFTFIYLLLRSNVLFSRLVQEGLMEKFYNVMSAEVVDENPLEECLTKLEASPELSFFIRGLCQKPYKLRWWYFEKMMLFMMERRGDFELKDYQEVLSVEYVFEMGYTSSETEEEI